MNELKTQNYLQISKKDPQLVSDLKTTPKTAYSSSESLTVHSRSSTLTSESNPSHMEITLSEQSLKKKNSTLEELESKIFKLSEIVSSKEKLLKTKREALKKKFEKNQRLKSLIRITTDSIENEKINTKSLGKELVSEMKAKNKFEWNENEMRNSFLIQISNLEKYKAELNDKIIEMQGSVNNLIGEIDDRKKERNFVQMQFQKLLDLSECIKISFEVEQKNSENVYLSAKQKEIQSDLENLQAKISASKSMLSQEKTKLKSIYERNKLKIHKITDLQANLTKLESINNSKKEALACKEISFIKKAHDFEILEGIRNVRVETIAIEEQSIDKMIEDLQSKINQKTIEKNIDPQADLLKISQRKFITKKLSELKEKEEKISRLEKKCKEIL
ncbi:unnamed protein product [Blepharisma stoltei]|uniref:Uncharacterized protein n=1 Tax=Blepharisma stoltei TaxID=1481888 RepID=A0AAU9I941_9CILI|nr:unnamed protein product [Blepharisma stoltei]